MADNISTIGSDGDDDYSTPQAWEDATDNDLVAAGNREFGLLRGEAHSSVRLNLGTYNASFYRWLSTIDASHNFNHTNLTGARLVATSGANTLLTQNPFFRAGGTEGSSAGSIGLKLNVASGVKVNVYVCTATDNKVDQIVVYNSENTDEQIRGFTIQVTGGCVLNNCLVFNLNASASKFAWGFRSDAAGNAVCNFCTSWDVKGGGANACFHNCETNGCYAGDSNLAYGGTTSGDWNAGDDTSAPGANSIDNKAGSDQFVSVTVGSENFHLKSGAALIDASQDTANEADLDNGDGITTRDDHGCLEFVSAGGVAPDWYYRNMRRRRNS